MAEPRRVQLSSVSSSTSLQPSSPKKPRIDDPDPETSVAATVRIALTLFEPDQKKCPEFFYPELLNKLQGNNKKHPEKKPLDPFNTDEAERKEVEALSKRLEEKYGKKRRRDRMQDLVDMGYGYDESDSFIDNSEAYDELVPASLTTKYGGFYINSGTLQFRQASDTEDESVKGKKKKSPKKIKERGDKVKRPNREDEKKSKKSKYSKLGITALNGTKDKKKKKMLMANLQEMLARFEKDKKDFEKWTPPVTAAPTSITTPKTSSSSSPALPPPPPREAEPAPDPLLSTIESKRLPASSAMDSMTEKQVRNLETPPEKRSVAHPGEAGKEAFKKQQAAPEGLPPALENKIKELAKWAQTPDGEKKFKCFSPEINPSLLDIYLQCRDLSSGLRSSVFSHLSSVLPCSKDLLVRWSTRLYLQKKGERLREPLRKLKEAVAKAMPEQITVYHAELKVYNEAKYAKTLFKESRRLYPQLSSLMSKNKTTTPPKIKGKESTGKPDKNIPSSSVESRGSASARDSPSSVVSSHTQDNSLDGDLIHNPPSLDGVSEHLSALSARTSGLVFEYPNPSKSVSEKAAGVEEKKKPFTTVSVVSVTSQPATRPIIHKKFTVSGSEKKMPPPVPSSKPSPDAQQKPLSQHQPGSARQMSPHQPGPAKQITPHQPGPAKQITPHQPGPAKQITPHQPGPGKQMSPHQPGPAKQITPHPPGPTKAVSPHQPGPAKPVSPHQPGPAKPVSPHQPGPGKQITPHQPGPIKQMSPHQPGPIKQMSPHQPGPIKQMSPHQPGPIKQMSPHQPGPIKQMSLNQPGPAKQITPHQAGPAKQVSPHQAGPAKQVSPHQAGPAKQMSPHQAGPAKQMSPHQAGPAKQMSMHQPGQTKSLSPHQPGQVKQISMQQPGPVKTPPANPSLQPSVSLYQISNKGSYTHPTQGGGAKVAAPSQQPLAPQTKPIRPQGIPPSPATSHKPIGPTGFIVRHLSSPGTAGVQVYRGPVSRPPAPQHVNPSGQASPVTPNQSSSSTSRNPNTVSTKKPNPPQKLTLMAPQNSGGGTQGVAKLLTSSMAGGGGNASANLNKGNAAPGLLGPAPLTIITPSYKPNGGKMSSPASLNLLSPISTIPLRVVSITTEPSPKAGASKDAIVTGPAPGTFNHGLPRNILGGLHTSTIPHPALSGSLQPAQTDGAHSSAPTQVRSSRPNNP
ncbi:ubinuclein-1 isoform X2 [Engystomops pustulosus]|uniref:ubinuclein-1 isoform X2 n=1 Tax=Engystomops pustulosus TaxID=76066 RepID=UPI003AFAFF48